MLSSWNLFEKLWLSIFLLIGWVIAYVQQDNWLSFIVLLTGIVCVVLAAKGNITNYYFGLFNSCCYAYICYHNGLYGEMALNLLFFVPTGILGIFFWRKHIQNQQLLNARALSLSFLWLLLLFNLICICLLGYALAQIPTQNTPYIDATTNILAIFATFLMMLRYKEQWYFYILLNAFSILMWWIRTLDGSQEGLMMLVMWSAFLINAFYGFYNWRKMASAASHSLLTTEQKI